MSDSLKKTSALLICSFLVSDLSDLLKSLILMSDLRYSLTSLNKKEGMSESLGFLTYKKRTKNTILVKKKLANCSFFVSKRANE